MSYREIGREKRENGTPIVLAVYGVATPCPTLPLCVGADFSPHSLLPPPDCHPDRSGGICFTRRRGTIHRAPLRCHFPFSSFWFLVSGFAFLVSDFNFLSACHRIAQP